MDQLKLFKIYFCLATLVFVAKPFLGFTIFSRTHPPAVENIFVKVFSKRKQEFNEDSSSNIITIQKKLAEPLKDFLLRFSFLLSLLFPAIFGTGNIITNRFLRKLQLSLSPVEPTYLLNNTFRI